MDTGLTTLVAIARFHQLPAEAEQLSHEFGQPGEVFSDTEILRAAKALTLKAKHLKPELAEIKSAMLPAIAKAKDGSYFILAKIAFTDVNTQEKSNEKSAVLIQDLREQSPKTLSLEEFKSLWSGELIALTRRHGLGESLQQKFDISWFIPSLVKYRFIRHAYHVIKTAIPT